MESLNVFNGYGKVNNPSSDLEYQQQRQQQQSSPKRRRVILAASFAICLTVIIAAMIGALVHDSATDSKEEEEEQHPNSSSLTTDSTESLKTVCAVTQHLDSCINSISSLNDPPKSSDPVHFFNLSLQVSLRELTNLSSLPRNLISKSNNPRAESALKDCVDLFDDSLSRLKQSVELMKGGNGSPGKKLLTKIKISDMQTWISAAMTDQDTCLDGLDEMGSTVVDEVRAKVQKSSEYMSNSLAILNNLENLLGKFGLKMP